MTKITNIEVASAKQLAEKELKEERVKEATAKIKSKLKEIEKAKQIVKNLERELEDLELEISQEY